jgi:hypothetical protein
MKKLVFIISIAIIGVATTTSVKAQKSKSSFAGTMKFSTKYEGNTNPQQHVPYDLNYTVFGNRVKLNAGIQTILMDGNTVSVTVLLDIPGNRIGYTQTKEAIEAEQATMKYTITKGEDTKTICGYVCDHYDITVYDAEEDEETKVIVYTTTEIGENNNINSLNYPGLTGFPLYTEQELSGGVKKIDEAMEVKKGKIKATDLMLPIDYKIYNSLEEFQEKIKELQKALSE